MPVSSLSSVIQLRTAGLRSDESAKFQAEHENLESNASPLSDPERELLEEKKENDAKRQARGTGILALLCLLLFIHSVVMAVKWSEARTREDDLKLQLQQAQALARTLPPDELEEVDVDVDVDVGALATVTRVRMVTETSLMWLGPTDANGAALPPPWAR